MSRGSISEISIKQRFHTFGDGYAPISIGTPAFTNAVDYSVFKHTKEEKMDKLAAKYKHKLFLKHHFKGNPPKKVLNIPQYQLETPIRITN